MNKLFEAIGLLMWIEAMLLAALTALTHRGVWVRWIALAILGVMITAWIEVR